MVNFHVPAMYRKGYKPSDDRDYKNGPVKIWSASQRAVMMLVGFGIQAEFAPCLRIFKPFRGE